MSCETNSKKGCGVARRNGVWGLTSRYLNVLGNWSTWSDINSLEQIPERLEKITAAYFGISGVTSGRARVVIAILAAKVGIGALEQTTASMATFGVKTLMRGEPIGLYQGLTIRKSPITQRYAAVLNRVTGGRVIDYNGYYFSEQGRTWHCQYFTVQIGDTTKTLAHVKSLGVPSWEYFFDRPISVDPEGDPRERVVAIQSIIETVKAKIDPSTIQGYIGSSNDFESLTPLKDIKRAFFALNWLLVDELERDGGDVPELIDYDSLFKKPDAQTNNAKPLFTTTRSAGPRGTAAPLPTFPYPTTRSDMRGIYQQFGSQGYQQPPVATLGGNPVHYGAQYFSGGGTIFPLQGEIELNNQKFHCRINNVVRDTSNSITDAEVEVWVNDSWRKLEDENVRRQIVQDMKAQNLIQ